MGGRSRFNRLGFTLIELLTVTVLISILAAIALPALRSAINNAQAAQVLGDVHVVQTAYHQAWADGISPIGDAPWGTPPAALVPYLPDGFSFTNDLADYRWRRLSAGASPWGEEMGELRVRPKPNLRPVLVDKLANMANQAMIIKTGDQVRFYILP